MTCKKSSSPTLDVNTAIGSTVLDNIGMRYGESLRKELLGLNTAHETLGFKAKGWFSGANFSAKRGTFLFFINRSSIFSRCSSLDIDRRPLIDRLVDCSPLKRAFEAFYGALLPKNGHPFIYLSLEIDPTKLDVNIHPTKQEVSLMDADEIVEVVCEELQKLLASGSESRSYKVQVSVSCFVSRASLLTIITDSTTGCEEGLRRCPRRRLDFDSAKNSIETENRSEQTRTNGRHDENARFDVRSQSSNPHGRSDDGRRRKSTQQTEEGRQRGDVREAVGERADGKESQADSVRLPTRKRPRAEESRR